MPETTATAIEGGLQASAAYLAEAAGIDTPVLVTNTGAALSIQGTEMARDVITLPAYGYTAAVGVLAHEIAHLEAGDTAPWWSHALLGVASLSAAAIGWGTATAVTHTGSTALTGLLAVALGVALWWGADRLSAHLTEIAADTRAIELIDDGLLGGGATHTRAALDAARDEPVSSWLDRLLVRHRRAVVAANDRSESS